MFDRVACWISHALGRPPAMVITAACIIAGLLWGQNDITNLGISILSLVLLFFIQNSQNRDGAALQTKLDELIHAAEGARNEIAHVDEKTEAEIMVIREEGRTDG